MKHLSQKACVVSAGEAVGVSKHAVKTVCGDILTYSFGGKRLSCHSLSLLCLTGSHRGWLIVGLSEHTADTQSILVYYIICNV